MQTTLKHFVDSVGKEHLPFTLKQLVLEELLSEERCLKLDELDFHGFYPEN